MERNGFGGSARVRAFGSGVEDSSTAFVSSGGSIFHKASYGLNPLVIPGYNPQWGSHFSSTFPMGSNTFGSGFSYDNISIPDTTSNMKRSLVDFSNFAPSNSNSFASQIESFPLGMADNFLYSASALPCQSVALPTTSQCTLLPETDSSVNCIKNEYLHAKENKNQEGYICNRSSKSIQSRENNRLGMPQISRQLMINPSMKEFDDDFKVRGLKLILQKELSNSDVGTVGRIVLPKEEAEANLPPLIESEGIILNMDDLVLQVSWIFKYRFWPNKKSRMYIMESTGGFIKAHGLQAGDYFIIYRSSTSLNYVVRGKTGVRPQTRTGVLHCDCRNECSMNADCPCQLPIDKHERGDSRQLWLEQGKNFFSENTRFHHFSQP